MKNIFVDTSFFEENNFFKGKLVTLYDYAKEGYVKLYTNEIVIREVKNRITKRMDIAKKHCHNLFNNSDLYILGNTSYAEAIRNLKDKNIFRAEENKLYLTFDNVINNIPFTIIPYDEIDFRRIIDDYFKENPPFKEGEKKNEFPDAFIISSIEQYCKKNNIEIIAISKDHDWVNYTSPYFKITKDINPIFEEIAKEIESDTIKFVSQLLRKHENNILSQIKAYIIDYGDFTNTDFFDSEITNIAIRKLSLNKMAITHIDKPYADVVLSLGIDLTADITFPDYDNAYWDKEEQTYYFLEEMTLNHDFDLSVDVLISVEYNLKDDSFYDLNIKSLNNEKSIDLSINDESY